MSSPIRPLGGPIRGRLNPNQRAALASGNIYGAIATARRGGIIHNKGIMSIPGFVNDDVELTTLYEARDEIMNLDPKSNSEAEGKEMILRDIDNKIEDAINNAVRRESEISAANKLPRYTSADTGGVGPVDPSISELNMEDLFNPDVNDQIDDVGIKGLNQGGSIINPMDMQAMDGMMFKDPEDGEQWEYNV